MKRKLLIFMMSAIMMLMVCGCGASSGYVNDRSYSTAKGDKLPVDVCDVDIAYQFQQPDMSGVNSIPVTAQLTNKTNVTFSDSYYLTFSCIDGSTGNLGYLGNIAPGQTIEMTGFILPKTAGYVYKADDITFTNVLTGFDPNSKQHGTISCDIAKQVYEWTYMPSDEYYKK